MSGPIFLAILNVFSSCLRINSFIPASKDIYQVPSPLCGTVLGAENTFAGYLNDVFKNITI